MTEEPETRYEKRKRLRQCTGCGADEGSYHDCDHERCPWCGGQFGTCGCNYRKIGYNYEEFEPFCGLPPEIYFNGLGEEDRAKLDAVLEEFGRVPYVDLPQRCARCGENWDGFTYNLLDYWEYYFPGGQLICENCYNRVKFLIDTKNPITGTRKKHIMRKRELVKMQHQLYCNKTDYVFKQSILRKEQDDLLLETMIPMLEKLGWFDEEKFIGHFNIQMEGNKPPKFFLKRLVESGQLEKKLDHREWLYRVKRT
jgi:hypothetical protein